MRVFLDVGAHEGQTLDEVLRPEHGFDLVYAFEPLPAQYATLVERFGARDGLTLLDYGLADRTAVMPVYGTNEGMEASLYPAKRDLDAGVVTDCRFVEASAFFAGHLPDDATVVVKLNCEGAEVAILENLIATGQIWKIANVMIDFDVRKIPGMEDHETRLLARLDAIGFDRHVLCEHVMLGETHAERIAHWLTRA